MAPNAYEQVSGQEVLQTLRDWAYQHGGLPGSLEDVLDLALFSVVTSATRLYRLRELGDSAFHDWGRVHVDFHEVIAIDDKQLLATLLVAADD